MFFENLIPTVAPEYIAVESKAKFTEIFKRVHDRMDKLEEALTKTSLRGEVFSAAVKPLMQCAHGQLPPLDGMTASEIAQAAALLAKGLDWSSIPDRIQWKNALTVVDAAFVTTSEWEAIRHLGIGGSDSACVMDDGYRIAAELYYDKIGSKIAEETIDNGLRFIYDFGHKIEDLTIDHFCRISGAKRVPETRMFAHKDYPFLMANVDAIIVFPDGRIFVFEAKTTNGWNDKAWQDESIPRHYIPQCRKYPLVLDDDRVCGTYIGCVMGNTPDKFICHLVERNKTEEQAQLEGEVRFWKDYVLAGIEPPSNGTAKAVVRLAQAIAKNTEPDPAPFTLPAEIEDTMKLYLEIKATKKEAEAKVDVLTEQLGVLSAEIIRSLNGNTEGRYPCPEALAPGDGEWEIVAKNSPRAKTTVDKDVLKEQFPDAYEACVTIDKDAFRVFSLDIKRKKVGKKK